jgi:hypothetical protein
MDEWFWKARDRGLCGFLKVTDAYIYTTVKPVNTQEISEML